MALLSRFITKLPGECPLRLIFKQSERKGVLFFSERAKKTWPPGLINKDNPDAFPAVEPYFRETAKKTLFLALVLGGASFAFLTPLLASASIFSSLLLKTVSQSVASGSPLNSQTMGLLTPAHNIDPSPAMGGGDITVVGGVALLAQEGPSGTAADIEHALPEATAISVYTVHKGDTLGGVALMFGVSVNTIKGANDIKGGIIHEGDTLVILPITGVRYTTVWGDTLAGVAKKYKADAHEIAQYNDLEDGASLAVGVSLIIPDGELTLPAPVHSTIIAKSPLRGAGGPALSGYYAWPVNGGVLTQGLHGYNGIDIGAQSGTNILAAADGTVIIAKSNGAWNGGYGNYVVIQHDNGTQTLYGHASRVYVSVGQQVAQGGTIAAVGRTGKATGSHLHFEVRGATNPFGK